MEARWAHNPKVGGSNPPPATNLPPDLLQAVAQQIAQQILANLMAGTQPVPPIAEPGALDLEEGIPLWAASLKAKHYSPRTIKGYEDDVRRYLQHDPNPTRLSIEGYIARRFDEVSSSRVAGEQKALRSFFKFLTKAELIAVNPTAELEGFPVTYTERELPAKEDIDRLLGSECYKKSNTPKFRTMLTLLANTGLRITEACSIKKADINFDGPEIKVMGKGRKPRIVPISPHVAQVLKAWIERDGQSPWLFPGDTKTGYWHISGFEGMLRWLCRRLGIKPFSPHALRHYFATYSLRNGARLEVISKILGHSSVAITADLYDHISREEIHETHQKFSPFAMPEAE